ncbi:MAG: hypothetical protein WBE37_32230 [Bryobacteraceae bacterium]
MEGALFDSTKRVAAKTVHRAWGPSAAKVIIVLIVAAAIVVALLVRGSLAEKVAAFGALLLVLIVGLRERELIPREDVTSSRTCALRKVRKKRPV